MEEFEAPFSPFFTDIQIQDPADCNRPGERVWWKRSDVPMLLQEQQKLLEERPGCLALAHYGTRPRVMHVAP